MNILNVSNKDNKGQARALVPYQVVERLGIECEACGAAVSLGVTRAEVPVLVSLGGKKFCADCPKCGHKLERKPDALSRFIVTGAHGASVTTGRSN